MSSILVLPGTKWQLELVKRIHDLGHEALVVSPEDNSPCKDLATDYFQSDIFDIDSIEQYALRNHIEAVISDECDIAMPVVAELGKRLGLNTLSAHDASLYTDKYQMRRFCTKNGLNTPKYRLCENLDDAKTFLRELGKTIIIKPLDSNASHGVFTIENESDLEKLFDDTISYSRTRKAVIAEEYIIGTEFTVDGIKTPLNHYTLAISEKKHFAHNKNIAYELLFTHSSDKYDYDLLRQTNDDFVMKSGLRFGFTHGEYKYSNGKYYLIEIAARGGGNLISALITQYMSGYDTYKYLIDCSLGRQIPNNSSDFSIRSEYTNNASVLYFFQAPNGGGKVKRVRGIRNLINNTNILDYSLNFKCGDFIEDPKNDSVRIGYYIAGCKDKDSLTSTMNDVMREFAIDIDK